MALSLGGLNASGWCLEREPSILHLQFEQTYSVPLSNACPCTNIYGKIYLCMYIETIYNTAPDVAIHSHRTQSYAHQTYIQTHIHIHVRLPVHWYGGGVYHQQFKPYACAYVCMCLCVRSPLLPVLNSYLVRSSCVNLSYDITENASQIADDKCRTTSQTNR